MPTGTPEDRRKEASKAARRYATFVRKYDFPAYELMNCLIEMLMPENVTQMLAAAPAEVVSLIREELDRLPTTDEGWAKLIDIFGGISVRTRVISPEEEAELEAKEKRHRQLRWEFLRAYFALREFQEGSR